MKSTSTFFRIFLLVCISSTFWCARPAAAEVNVFVSIPPQKWLVDQIGQQLVHTDVLVPQGQDPHIFEPTPKLITALSKSDLYFTIDLEFEEQLLKRIGKNRGNLRIIDTVDAIARIPMTEHQHDEKDAGGHHDHDAFDPHVWLSANNLKIMGKEMSRALTAADPANEAVYTRNYERLCSQLESVHREIAEELKPFQGKAFYVFHPSFGYFAKDYGLVQLAVEISGKSPSPRQMAKVISQAQQEGIKVLFVQPQFDPKSAQTIAASIKGEVVPLDALSADVAENLRTISHRIAAGFSH